MSDAGDNNDYSMQCVSCGRPIKFRNHVPEHHECSKTHEAALKAANTRAHDDIPTQRTPSFGKRLDVGFQMLNEDDEEDND